MRRSIALVLLLQAVSVRGADVPSPASALGFTPGADRRLPTWKQVVEYFRSLDSASPRVEVRAVGPTTEGREYLVAVVSSEANMARIEEIRRDNLALADPRALSSEQAAALLRRGKVVVALSHGIHSTEAASPLTAMVTAHRLASSESPEVRRMLDEVVVLVTPSQNPDGTQRVAEWYSRTLGTPFEGTNPPFLYQRYTGHDNNRDWYMFTQRETRLSVEHVHDSWRPHIVHDLHQMGARGARIFVPPYIDPFEPNVDPALVSSIGALGTHVAARLTSAGRRGVLVAALFDAWTPSRAYPHTHGGVRILSETASVRLATPVTVKPEELAGGTGYDARRASWNFPLPWEGGAWTLGDIVDYQLDANLAILDHAAKNRQHWLESFVSVLRRACQAPSPFAFVIPEPQQDPLATARLLSVLRRGSVEIAEALGPFEAEGRSFSAGSHVVSMRQPFSAFAKTLLERQQYPDLRQYVGGPPLRPYDVTAHTLPLLMGVEVRAVASPFVADLRPVTEVEVAPRRGRVEGRGSSLAIGHRTGELVAVGRLLRRGVEVRWTQDAFTDHGERFAAGTFLVPASARRLVGPMAQELGFVVRATDARPKAMTVRMPRIAIYQSFVPSMDEGWTRFVLEQDLGLDFVTVRDADVRKGGLRDRFDALVLPSQARTAILAGHAPGAMPEEYTGGLGADGVRAVRTFVEGGGTLVALSSACAFPVAELGLPVRIEEARIGRTAAPARGGDQDQGLFCPGAILRASFDASSPLTHGMDPMTPIWFEQGPVFDSNASGVVARFPDENPLLSGLLLGDGHIRGKAALLDLPLGAGRVVLFAFRPQYRAQSWATYVPFVNALFLSATRPSRRERPVAR
jgi:hypothetical protein